MIAALRKAPILLQFITKRQRTDKHATGLFKGEADTIEYRHADNKALSAADTTEVDCQRKINHRKGRYSVLCAESIDCIV